MQNKLILLFSTLLFSFSSFSQNADDDSNYEGFSPLEKFYVGGNVTLRFGTITDIGIAPYVGYKLTDQLSIGVGGQFSYFKNSFNNLKFSTKGGNVFARYLIIPQLFVQAEQSIITYRQDLNGTKSDIITGNAALIGLGYRQEISSKMSWQIAAFYDLTQDPYYVAPFLFDDFRLFIRAGINYNW